MSGIGRDWGMESHSPCCNLRSSIPASMRASCENGGVLISPLSHTNGLEPGTESFYIRSDMDAIVTLGRPVRSARVLTLTEELLASSTDSAE